METLHGVPRAILSSPRSRHGRLIVTNRSRFARRTGMLIGHIARAWGVRPEPERGKAVWAEIDLR